jgi:hypothetical protein
MKRSQVSSGSLVIRYTHSAAPISGMTGTNGTRKPRSMSGFERRSQITAMFTMRNANSVPNVDELRDLREWHKGGDERNRNCNTAVSRTGVLVRSHTFASRSGMRPSRLIAKATRVCP